MEEEDEVVLSSSEDSTHTKNQKMETRFMSIAQTSTRTPTLKKPQQIDPPTIPVVKLFPSAEFPEGEIQQYKDV